MSYVYVGKNVPRQDALLKVTGTAGYTDDLAPAHTLHAALLTSTRSHARIVSIDRAEALQLPGVRAVVTGSDFPVLTGSPLEDWPLLALDVVRYMGEPVTLVVADELQQAMSALAVIDVTYEDLPVVQSPRLSVKSDAPVLHPLLASYRKIDRACPIPGTNIANHTKIRKGDVNAAWKDCDIVIETEVVFPGAHHAAMETHVATAQISPDGRVEITTSSQAPYALPDMVEQVFSYPRSNVTVHTPLVGGGFGGKAPAYWELLAVAGSIATGGRPVHLRATREQAMYTLPGHIGLEGAIRLGAKANGELVAAKITFWFDGGAYSNRGLIVTRAAATDCTGPYRLPNVWCDSYCIYTNHPPATAYRGFGHPEATFLIERALDQLAEKLSQSPFTLRRRNAILPGDTAPTQALLTRSNVGNLPKCLERLQTIMSWSAPDTLSPPGATTPETPTEKLPGATPASKTVSVASPIAEAPAASMYVTSSEPPTVIRAKGLCCIWKNSSTPANAGSAAIVKVERDGTVTVTSGAVEIGQGTKTALAQMVAEVFQMSVDRVRVILSVHTTTMPEHWKTVASRTSLLAGNATVRAAQDAVRQLQQIAAVVLHSEPNGVRIGNGKATILTPEEILDSGTSFSKTDGLQAEAVQHSTNAPSPQQDTEHAPSHRRQIDIGKLSHGYVLPDGRTVGAQVIGVGRDVIDDVVPIDEDTGRGVTGPEWTVGAQGVEVEFHPHDCTYRVLRAVSVIDCGQVIHPSLARGQILGGMNMGLSLASREGYVHSTDGKMLNPQFRTYPVHRYGDHPAYIAEFVETPHHGAPFGLRGIGEHGLIGMPAALANALSLATGHSINFMPMTPEALWYATRYPQRPSDTLSRMNNAQNQGGESS